MRNKLKEYGYENVPVLKLIHPTELNGFEKFDYQSFALSPVKKITQVGAWLRDSYAIYNLNVPSNYIKIALKGKGMENYFIDDDSWKNIEKCISSSFGDECISGSIVKGKYINKYVKGLLESLGEDRRSVFLISDLDNKNYDNILKTSVVFLKLVDAAAVNTIIECIVRNTPIIVNRLPATEQYLGKNYPLFYDRIEDVIFLLTDKNIKKAYDYLRRMDKTKFSIEHFLTCLINSNLYKNL